MFKYKAAGERESSTTTKFLRRGLGLGGGAVLGAFHVIYRKWREQKNFRSEMNSLA